MTRYKRIQKICHESFLRKLLEDVGHQKQKITHQNVNKKKKKTCAILNVTLVTLKK